MEIRKAGVNDSDPIAECLFLAMEDIVYHFLKSNDRAQGEQFMRGLVGLAGNQYSYENCWVLVENGTVLAAACLYDGALLETLRRPVAAFVHTHYGLDFNPENETGAGEIYLDTLGVLEQHQGKGLGKALLKFLIDTYVNGEGKVIGLLVDKENPGAKKLYLRVGFSVVGEKKLAGKTMEHLQVGNRAGAQTFE